ncbi:DUF1801 domain-containing protein [Pseudoxanthomonas sp. SL93]|uniref:DUF1801 domain-containing protein n=1 Tax=Pseudoxanthomonas sp. SL93 TaxID=2995142 RepID=UPI0022700E01|nr:DUF1801 domain-containing protein [Pseudoxanthomonas sp. SL93]WAC62709.1 DUF1801 domain-containing protein [Pseudoxanthomonas sp. SL93]
MPARRPAKAVPDVDAFIAALDHPLVPVVVALRQAILGADASIGEAVKWNAPSFHTTGHFATMHLRNPAAVQLILHLGAKKRPLPKPRIDDPGHLLTWLGEDRATVSFTSLQALEERRDALQAIIHQWITHV